MSIILYQFPSTWGLPNASTFCMKLETFLRMNALPYTVKTVMNPAQAPKGKLPFVEIDGMRMGDSAMIIDYLTAQHRLTLDAHMGEQQWATMQLLEGFISDRLYWILLYQRWQVEAHWPATRASFFGNVPKPLFWVVSRMVRKKMLRALHAHGLGRHTVQEIDALSDTCLKTLSIMLGNNPFFMGGACTSIDANAFAHLANIVWVPYDNSLTRMLRAYPNLLEYCNRMWDSWYSDVPKPCVI